MPARSPEYMYEMRERILVATLSCLERKGLANASLSDVCEEAGISRGALYVHFRSKSEILCGVLDRSANQVSEKYKFQDALALHDVLASEFDSASPTSPLYSPLTLYVETELCAAARTDEPLREAIRRYMDARFNQMRVGMHGLATRGQLRSGVSVEVATRVVSYFIDGTMSLAFGTPVTTALHQESLLALLHGILTPKAFRSLSIVE